MSMDLDKLTPSDINAEPTPVLRLKDAFNLKDLIDSSETVFEVRSDELKGEEEEEMKDFKYDNIKPFINMACVDGNDDDNDQLTPFERLKKKMTKLDTAGKVMKCIKTMGVGEEIPENAVVYIHYNAYTELEEIPYDVTFLRNKDPMRFVLGKSGIIPGLEVAIKSMKKSEKAQFLVHPDLAYGKMGCPPRIPPEATILLEVELVRFSDNPQVDEEEIINREKLQFDNVQKHVKTEFQIGLNFCTENNHKAAAVRFRKALSILQAAQLKDEEEKKQQKELLLELYVNLVTCFSEKSMDAPQKVCIYVSDAIRDCGNDAKNNAKLQKFWGKALFQINEFKRASQCLVKAKSLNPTDPEIPILLGKIEEKQKQYLTNEKKSCQKMFGFAPKKVEKEKEVSKSMESLKRQFGIFMAGKAEHLNLPSGLTVEEETFCKDFAKSLGLYVRTIEQGHFKTIQITKPSNL